MSASRRPRCDAPVLEPAGDADRRRHLRPFQPLGLGSEREPVGQAIRRQAEHWLEPWWTVLDTEGARSMTILRRYFESGAWPISARRRTFSPSSRARGCSPIHRRVPNRSGRLDSRLHAGRRNDPAAGRRRRRRLGSLVQPARRPLVARAGRRRTGMERGRSSRRMAAIGCSICAAPEGRANAGRRLRLLTWGIWPNSTS